MTPEEIKAIITLVQRAPLHNMQEAVAAQHLCDKLSKHFAPPELSKAKRNAR
jgi:hypothetical protein